jgi:hypothetical protein
MNIKQFVEETLQQILEGVSAVKRRDRRVAPSRELSSNLPSGTGIVTVPAAAPSLVEFDVAVTVTTTTEGKVKGQLIAIAGAEATGTHENSKVSRVKFSVPLELTAPTPDEKESCPNARSGV